MKPPEELLECYQAIVNASKAGANVTKQINEFNLLLKNLNKTPETELARRALEIKTEALKLAQQAQTQTLINITIAVAVAIIVVVLAVFFYVKYRYRLWLLWIRMRGGYRVYPGQGGGKRESMITSGEVWAVILAVMIVASVFAVAQVITAGRVVEPFSELGLLGPKMKIGDYPTRVLVGDKIKLYIYIGNHMGYPVWYIVYAKLGNRTTFVNSTIPANLPPIWKYQILLPHNSNTTKQVTLTMNKTGTNLKLIFELWYIDPTTGEQKYYTWTHLYLNVTAPPTILK